MVGDGGGGRKVGREQRSYTALGREQDRGRRSTRCEYNTHFTSVISFNRTSRFFIILFDTLKIMKEL